MNSTFFRSLHKAFSSLRDAKTGGGGVGVDCGVSVVCWVSDIKLKNRAARVGDPVGLQSGVASDLRAGCAGCEEKKEKCFHCVINVPIVSVPAVI